MAELHSILRLLESVVVSNFIRPRHTLKLTLALTERCSFACKTCRIWAKKNPAEPTLEDLEGFFSLNREFAWIDLTGGEIFEREDLPEVVEIVYRHCRHLYLLHFPTNGWWPDRTASLVQKAREFRRLRLIITVSVDGPEELHDELRGKPGSFKRAVETIKSIRNVPGVQVFAGMTLGPRNLGAVEDTIEALRAHLPGFGPDELHVNFINKSAHYFNNLDCPTADNSSLRAALGAFRRLRGFPLNPELLIEYIYLRLVPRFFASGRTPIFCQSLTNNCFVSADWTLYPCTIWDHPLVNLKEIGFDLQTAWKSPKIQEARRRIASRECPNCWTPCEAYPSILGMGRSLLNGV